MHQTPGAEIYAILKNIENSSGLLKQVPLRMNENNNLLRKTLTYALDPKKRFYVQGNFQPGTGEISQGDFSGFFAVLDKLAARILSGHAGQLALAAEFRNSTVAEAEVMNRILNKDLKCGVSLKTANKVFPVAKDYACMLAVPFDESKIKFPAWMECKYNGKRQQSEVIISAEGPKLVGSVSRLGNPVEGYKHLTPQIEEYAKQVYQNLPIWFTPNNFADTSQIGMILDGELMWGMFGDRKQQEAAADFVIYDVIPLHKWKKMEDGEKVKTHPQKIRSELLTKSHHWLSFPCPNIKPALGRLVHNLAEAKAFYTELVEAGHEGAIIKNPEGVYELKRSGNWMKWKPVLDADLEILEVYPGQGKYTGMAGGLMVNYKGKSVGIGTGFTDAERYELWQNRAEMVGRIAEIQYRQISPDGSLVHTNFVKIRDDK